MGFQWEHSMKDVGIGKELYWLFKIQMVGFLEDFVMKLLELLLNFMELERTSYSHSKMEINQLFIIGQERTIRCNGATTNQWG